ncbi:MAG: hypothetical protein RLZZ428_591, partial [Pseudomonadota bacterium]
MSRQNDKNRGKNKADGVIMNDEIRAHELRVLSSEGEQLGIISKDEALQKAEQEG